MGSPPSRPVPLTPAAPSVSVVNGVMREKSNAQASTLAKIVSNQQPIAPTLPGTDASGSRRGSRSFSPEARCFPLTAPKLPPTPHCGKQAAPQSNLSAIQTASTPTFGSCRRDGDRNSLVVCDESRYTKSPFSFVVLS